MAGCSIVFTVEPVVNLTILLLLLRFNLVMNFIKINVGSFLKGASFDF